MKLKIIALVFSLLLLVLFFSGCGEDEHPSGLIGVESDFYGTWVKSDNSGGFGIGDTYEFKDDKSCEIYWSHGGTIHHYGTWDRNVSENGFNYILVISLGEKDTIYSYDFFDGYTTLRLREQNSDSYVYFYKQ